MNATYPAHYSQAPAAPGSLSPVAMSSSRNAANTGPQRAQETVVIRPRPNVRTGFAILLAGALLGGVLGITMRARDNAAEAAFAAQVSADTATTTAVAPPAAAPLPAGTVLAPAPVTTLPFGAMFPQQQPAVPVAPTFATIPAAPPAPGPVAAAGGKRTFHWGGGRPAAAGGHPNLSTKVNTPPAPPKEKDDGYKVASAGSEPKEPAEPKEPKAVTKPKEPKESKEPAEQKEAKKPAKKGSDDAASVLKAAMGATENTL